MFIAYDIKNGVEYGKAVVSQRVNGKVQKSYINLGRVLDKDKLIFRSRERGVFTFDLGNCSFEKTEESFVPHSSPNKKEKLILDFGDAFFLDKFIKDDGLLDPINSIGYGNPDTLYAMIDYYILCSMSNCHAAEWWEGSYASILYPKANLTSQRISDFLVSVGDEYSLRRFFNSYIRYVEDASDGTDSILIDSTGLPNSIHFPLTAISNHNGDINNEVRLIYVTHQKTGLPIYFRYCPGNVVDVTTIATTLAELKASGVNTKFAIMDAGYYSAANMDVLFTEHVSFVTRLRENTNLYSRLLEEHLAGIECEDNMVEYNGRYAFVKPVACDIKGEQGAYRGYAYVCLDIMRQGDETRKLFKRASAQCMATADIFQKMRNHGVFILLSTRKIARDKILPTYYSRQQIEQIFDIGKNYADMTPLRVQEEETFRGHLLLTFIASVIVKRIQDRLKKTIYNPNSMMLNLRNQKCKVYDHEVIVQEAYKKANDCYKLFKIKCPITIPR